jgi:hypothetical protein
MACGCGRWIVVVGMVLAASASLGAAERLRRWGNYDGTEPVTGSGTDFGSTTTESRTSLGVPVVPPGYTRAADTDCGYPVCLTIQPRAGGPCGIYGECACSMFGV